MMQTPTARPAEAAKPKPVVIPPMTDSKYGSAEQIMALPNAKLVALLRDSGASVYAKAKACQRLAVIGDKSAVPALAPLLTDAQLSHYARTALETIPDASADEALRKALGQVQGRLLAGVVTSIGFRKDVKAIGVLARLRLSTDADVAKAADSALARIRPAL